MFLNMHKARVEVAGLGFALADCQGLTSGLLYLATLLLSKYEDVLSDRLYNCLLYVSAQHCLVCTNRWWRTGHGRCVVPLSTSRPVSPAFFMPHATNPCFTLYTIKSTS